MRLEDVVELVMHFQWRVRRNAVMLKAHALMRLSIISSNKRSILSRKAVSWIPR
jgi:hypothetical protein